MAETEGSSSVSTSKNDEKIDGKDNEFGAEFVQLVSQHQETPNNSGYYLCSRGGTSVTVRGKRDDPETVWKIHFTMDDDQQLLVILENKECSKKSGKVSVLGTEKDKKTGHYLLTIKEIDQVPTRLNQIDPSISFYKKLRSPGSEFVFFESAIKDEKKLLVGFDERGDPMPMHQVQQFTFDGEAYFRMIGYWG